MSEERDREIRGERKRVEGECSACGGSEGLNMNSDDEKDVRGGSKFGGIESSEVTGREREGGERNMTTSPERMRLSQTNYVRTRRSASDGGWR